MSFDVGLFHSLIGGDTQNWNTIDRLTNEKMYNDFIWLYTKYQVKNMDFNKKMWHSDTFTIV